MKWFYIVSISIIVFVMILLSIRLIWNLRLSNFQRRNKIETSRKNKVQLSTNIGALSLMLMVGIFTIVNGAFYFDRTTPKPNSFDRYEIEEVVYKNAKVFDSQKEFENVLKIIHKNANLQYDLNFVLGASKDNVDNGIPPRLEPGAPGYEETTQGENSPNISDTYNQVEGISEADILKIDSSGQYIFYGPRYCNLLYKIELDDNGYHKDSYRVLEFEDFVFTEMLLSEQYIIVFGNVYEEKIKEDFVYAELMHYWRYSKSSYKLIEIDSFEIVKEGFVDGDILEIRQVKDIIYILSSRYIKYNDKNEPIDLPDFNSVYYFDGSSNSYVITKLTSINLNNLEVNQIGFMGYNSGFFMGHEFIVLTNIKWEIDNNSSNTIYNKTTVIAIAYNELGELNYVGSAEVEGFVLNQYCVDDYEGLIKVVTTHGRNHKNSLYILKPKSGVDELEIIGLLDKGIGKPGEDVKSASFNQHTLKVVTFRQMDPLYTIDLSIPTKPKIVGEIEEPGFSSSLVIWDEAGNTIGLGYMATLDGRIIGFKVSAYRHDDDQPTQTIEFPYNDFNYFYIPAVYSQRQNLLVNKELGLYGFLINSSKYLYDENTYLYSYICYTQAMLLEVDFSKELPLTMTSLAEISFEDEFEKMVLVNDSIHLLSKNADFVYSISQKDLLEPLFLKRD